MFIIFVFTGLRVLPLKTSKFLFMYLGIFMYIFMYIYVSGWPKISLDFSITAYGKTRIAFLANPIFESSR